MWWITAEPDVATPGSWVLVCYNFSHAKPPATILVDFETEGESYETVLTADNPCVRVYVPPGCTGITVVDLSWQSADCAIAVRV